MCSTRRQAWFSYYANFTYARHLKASPGSPKGSAYTLSLHEIILAD